ncbi:MAG: zinc ribbon domain-containing protein [Calothrix sp. C42_A2020_038]|nr:zinc ribbon domain-containing protein [Calothrix sp. C42_A2020_038]
MNNTFCPRCKQQVDSQAVTCPYCRTELKAFGHPGIPLHRAVKDEYLCSTCTYHIDDSCNFPKRPTAKECTLYQNFEEYQAQQEQQNQKPIFYQRFQKWLQNNQTLLLLTALFVVCLLIAVST